MRTTSNGGNEKNSNQSSDKLLQIMEALAKENGFHLPPFCSWTPEEWDEKGHECDEIRDNKLGWDITDYGLGRFDELGFALVTIRNGNLKDPKYKKPYAEKLLMLYPGQDSLAQLLKC